VVKWDNDGRMRLYQPSLNKVEPTTRGVRCDDLMRFAIAFGGRFPGLAAETFDLGAGWCAGTGTGLRCTSLLVVSLTIQLS